MHTIGYISSDLEFLLMFSGFCEDAESLVDFVLTLSGKNDGAFLTN
jgi:hypothetical protein